MTQQTHTIAESNNFIVLDKYTKVLDTGDSYQSESDLERELIQDLLNQGMSLSPLSHRLRCWRMCGTNFSVLMVWCLTKVNGGVSQSSISTAPVTAARQNP